MYFHLNLTPSPIFLIANHSPGNRLILVLVLLTYRSLSRLLLSDLTTWVSYLALPENPTTGLSVGPYRLAEHRYIQNYKIQIRNNLKSEHSSGGGVMSFLFQIQK